MEVEQYYNLTPQDLERKQENIFVAFCLGNKFFQDKKNIKEYISWALTHTKEKVLLIVVDKIQITNYRARSNSSDGHVTRRIYSDGDQMVGIIKEVIKTFTKEEQEKLTLIRWEDYEQEDNAYYPTIHAVYKEFKNNKEFKEAILKAVKTSVTDRTFTEEKYFYLCDYVLDEFSVCYTGITYGGTRYGMYIYPYSDSVVDLIHSIQKGEVFTRLQKKLPEEKTKLIVLR